MILLWSLGSTNNKETIRPGGIAVRDTVQPGHTRHDSVVDTGQVHLCKQAWCGKHLQATQVNFLHLFGSRYPNVGLQILMYGTVW